MKKETYKINNYRLHIIKDNRYKTITTEIYFRKEIKKEEITIDSLLFKSIMNSNKEYPTRLEFERKIEDLYDAYIFGERVKKGNNIINSIGVDVLEDKYTEEGNFYKTLDFFKSIIFSPNIKDGKFDLKNFNYAKNNVINSIKQIEENINLKTNLELFDLLDKDACFSLNIRGYLEDVQSITRESLYEYYLKYFDNVVIDIYVMGNVDSIEIKNYFEKNFLFNNPKSYIKKEKYVFKNNEVKNFIKKDKTNQAILKIAYSLDKDINDYDKFAVGVLYNMILSGLPSSKFFQNIREKYSLCYYLSLMIIYDDSLAIITSEIEKENHNKIIELIDKEMEDINNGVFTDEDIENAKNFLIFSLNDIKEYYSDYINFDYHLNINTNYSLDEVVEMIKKVSKEEIISFSKKLRKHTIYLVGGDL